MTMEGGSASNQTGHPRVEAILSRIQNYSEELGLDLKKPEDRFKWFIASILFAKRISARIAKETYRRLEEEGLTTPDKILEAGWDRLVQVLDSGGYVRYDFSTASNLLEIVKKLREEYGDLEEVNRRSKGSRDLEMRLKEFKGIGPLGVNIFLRELRRIWDKADPAPSKVAETVGRYLGLDNVRLYESALVRLYLELCKRHLCNRCPLNYWCKEAKSR